MRRPTPRAPPIGGTRSIVRRSRTSTSPGSPSKSALSTTTSSLSRMHPRSAARQWAPPSPRTSPTQSPDPRPTPLSTPMPTRVQTPSPPGPTRTCGRVAPRPRSPPPLPAWGGLTTMSGGRRLAPPCAKKRAATPGTATATTAVRAPTTPRVNSAPTAQTAAFGRPAAGRWLLARAPGARVVVRGAAKRRPTRASAKASGTRSACRVLTDAPPAGMRMAAVCARVTTRPSATWSATTTSGQPFAPPFHRAAQASLPKPGVTM